METTATVIHVEKAYTKALALTQDCIFWFMENFFDRSISIDHSPEYACNPERTPRCVPCREQEAREPKVTTVPRDKPQQARDSVLQHLHFPSSLPGPVHGGRAKNNWDKVFEVINKQ